MQVSRSSNSSGCGLNLVALSSSMGVFPISKRREITKVGRTLREGGRLTGREMPIVFVKRSGSRVKVREAEEVFDALGECTGPISLQSVVTLSRSSVITVTSEALVSLPKLFRGNEVLSVGDGPIPSGGRITLAALIACCRYGGRLL